MNGRIHSIQTLGALDGPGLRTVVFMQGCPMRCVYCHNPDTWNSSGGTLVSVDELIKTVLRYKPYYGDTGGVTVSGGEPLLQALFVTELFRHCRHHGIHTALDTSGALAEFSLLNYTDLVILDLKSHDPHMFMKLTGRSLNHSVNFLTQCLEKKKELWIRQVIIPDVNDDKGSLEGLADLLLKACHPLTARQAYRQISLLPYHTLGLYKWEELKIDSEIKNKPPASILQVAELEKYLHHCLHF